MKQWNTSVYDEQTLLPPNSRVQSCRIATRMRRGKYVYPRLCLSCSGSNIWKPWDRNYWLTKLLHVWLRDLYWCMTFLLRPVGMRSTVISTPVCLCVCLSASISLESLDRSSQTFDADPLWPWLSPPPAALRHVMYFRFYGWHHFWP